jgi:hypothetical protein
MCCRPMRGASSRRPVVYRNRSRVRWSASALVRQNAAAVDVATRE